MKKLLPIIGILILLLVVSVSCKKKPIQPEAPVQEVSKYELIPGNYKMYDTLGNYLYGMQIQHKQGFGDDGYLRDSLEFINFDGQYFLKVYQTNIQPPNWPKYFFHLGSFDPLIDSLGNRTFFFGYDSRYNNDTIYIDFKKNNTKYYIFDMVPYYGYRCKQIGVKQH